MRNPDCPSCGHTLDTFADDYWCPQCRVKYTKNGLTSNEQGSKDEDVSMNNEEKELLSGKLMGISNKPPIILTNKRICTPTETVMLSDVLEAYTQRKGGFSSLSKLVLRLKNGTLREYSICIAKENMPSQAMGL